MKSCWALVFSRQPGRTLGALAVSLAVHVACLWLVAGVWDPTQDKEPTAVIVHLMAVTPGAASPTAVVPALPKPAPRHRVAAKDPKPAPAPAQLEAQPQPVVWPAAVADAPAPGADHEPCWQRVGQELTRRKDNIPSLPRRRGLRGKVIARFAIAADGRACDLRFDEADAPLAQDAVRELLSEPFSESCAGEGRWVVQFVRR